MRYVTEEPPQTDGEQQHQDDRYPHEGCQEQQEQDERSRKDDGLQGAQQDEKDEGASQGRAVAHVDVVVVLKSFAAEEGWFEVRLFV